MQKKQTFFNHTEGRILLFGLGLLGMFFCILLLSILLSPSLFQTLLSITATNIIFGRMAGLSIGIAAQMDTALLVLFNFFIESIMVLLLYPLFIQSWNRLELVTFQPLHDFFERSRKSVQKYRPSIQKYGTPGLLLFVITPLAMTGPVVGSFAGYLMGFSHTKTLGTILSATLIAISLWVYLIQYFKHFLITYSHIINIGFFTLSVILGVWYLIKRYIVQN